MSDGLVSNLALVMGIAGASQGAGPFVLLAGIAGLLAGAFSMAAGEYISMQSQRELFERQIALEKAELEAMPEEEQAELALVYRVEGLHRGRRRTTIAKRMFADPQHALDTLVREELGLDPDELGSAWGAAFGSFVAFAHRGAHPGDPVPARRPAAPAFVAAIALSLAALFAVGAGVSLLTGRGLLFSGGRQVLIGAAAAVVTYARRACSSGSPSDGSTQPVERPTVGIRLDPVDEQLVRRRQGQVLAVDAKDRLDQSRGSELPGRARAEPLGDPRRLGPALERRPRSSSRRRPSIETTATRPPPATSPTSSSHHWNSAIRPEG